VPKLTALTLKKEDLMFSMNFFLRRTRPYAMRLPPKLARRAMLSVRVQEAARQSFNDLALQQGMSVSEYVYRVLNDHLRNLERTKQVPSQRAL
jgi:predicted HicB family RNase H-like nuclease